MVSNKLLFFVIVFFILSSCLLLRHPFERELAKDNLKWKNRKEVIRHYNLKFKTGHDYFLIESYRVEYHGHWGCFYMNDSIYCFSKEDNWSSIEYSLFYYEDFIIKSLKEGNIDTLYSLSRSLKHIIPSVNFTLIRYVNGVYEEHRMNEFVIDANWLPDDN